MGGAFGKGLKQEITCSLLLLFHNLIFQPCLDKLDYFKLKENKKQCTTM